MPFGMGPFGWYQWPHMAYWNQYWSPRSPFPYWASFWRWTEEEERAFLEDQAHFLEEQLTQINKRLDELKKQEKEKK